ncbi:MAG: MBL fold metallo-hydrolase [Acidobacteriota bacterium]
MQPHTPHPTQPQIAFGKAALAAALALLLWSGAPIQAQRDWSQVQIKTIKVAPGVHMLQGAGGNIGVSSGDDGVVLIDDQFAPLTDKIKAAVAEISDQPIRFVLNTHWHSDHTGGNENFGKANTLIVAHDNVRRRMAAGGVVDYFQSDNPPAPKDALPVVTFDQTVTFHLNGDEVHAFHVPPAHTDGDSIIHLRKANVVHMGDLYFNGMYPFIDYSSGGSIDGVIHGVEKVLAMADDKTQIIPGHGPLSNRAELTAYRDMLRGVRDAIAPLVEAGKTLEEVVAAKPTAPFDEKWAKGFIPPEGFCKIVYNTLK